MKKIRLIALDMDGTILDQNTINTHLKDLLRSLTMKGVKIAFVTGRELSDIKTILNANHILGDYPHTIISEGRFIHHLVDGEYLPDIEWNLDRERDLETLRRSIGKMSFEFAERVKERVRPVDELIEDGLIFFAFGTIEEAEEARLILEELTKHFELAKIIRNKRFVGITCKTGLKGNCLLRALEHYGLRSDEVLAVGDSHNDEDMLNEVMGFNVATTSNADPMIKELVMARGGYLASNPIGEGVVEILSRYFTI